MSKQAPSLTKICAICGLQKPLSAFLQLSEKSGAMYGSVCSTCRQERREKSLAEKELEDSSRTETGKTIGTKERVKGETDKRDLSQKIEEEYHEERDKEALEVEIDTVKTTDTRQKERDHRESFLTRRPLLTDKKTEAPRALEAREQFKKAALDSQLSEKTSQLEKAAVSEEKEKHMDFSNISIDVSKVSVAQNPHLKQFLEREKGIAMNRIFGQRFNNATPPAKPSTQTPENETPAKDAEKKWGPQSRSR